SPPRGNYRSRRACPARAPRASERQRYVCRWRIPAVNADQQSSERSDMGEAGHSRLFGTDGVRGVAGEDLTARLAMDLSQAAAAVLAGDATQAGNDSDAGPARPLAVVGRDPRLSGAFLEAAVVAGLASAGVDVLRLGGLPHPGVGYL